jgi:hypothetical protein
MMQAKVLLVSPINIVKEYCIYDWLQMLKSLSFPDMEIFLVDNSPNADFARKIQGMGFNCVWEDPRGREIRYVMCSSNERARVKFLSGDYTHFFSLECDIFPPPDIIERLLSHDLDVVGTTYFTYQGWESRLQLRVNYPFLINEKERTAKFKVRYLTWEEAILFMDGQVKPIYENGIGCKLIKRHIIEQIPFRIDPLDTGFADSFLSQDMWRMGIENFVDTSIMVKHLNSNWNTVASDRGHKMMGINKGIFKRGSL